MILKYARFNSSPEFEQWQKDNNVDVCQITPLASSIVLGQPESGSSTGTVEVSVFVIYKDKETH